MALEKLPGNVTKLAELGDRIYRDLGGQVTTEVHNLTVNVYAPVSDRAITDAIRRELARAAKG